VAAHPQLGKDLRDLVKSLAIDAVETEDGAERLSYGAASAAEQQRREEFYVSLGKPTVGGSDAHDPAGVGICYALLPCAPDAAAVEAALRAGQTSAACRLNPEQIHSLAADGLKGHIMSLDGRYVSARQDVCEWLAEVTNGDSVTFSIYPEPGILWRKSF
jgi:hypothetical protein